MQPLYPPTANQSIAPPPTGHHSSFIIPRHHPLIHRNGLTSGALPGELGGAGQAPGPQRGDQRRLGERQSLRRNRSAWPDALTNLLKQPEVFVS
jgi:hypothetical protein